jgi:hypothetical protein
VGAELLRCEPLPRWFNRTASFMRAVENTTVHVIVFDSVLHCRTTMAGINSKPVERQHVGTTYRDSALAVFLHHSEFCRDSLGRETAAAMRGKVYIPDGMFDTAHTVPTCKGHCRKRSAKRLLSSFLTMHKKRLRSPAHEVARDHA